MFACLIDNVINYCWLVCMFAWLLLIDLIFACANIDSFSIFKMDLSKLLHTTFTLSAKSIGKYTQQALQKE